MAIAANVQTVEALWRHIEARDWQGARRLFVDAAIMTWPASGERFLDADAIIRVNALYPEGWRVRVVEVNAMVGRVHSIVEVVHGAQRFLASSMFRFDGQRIAEVNEYWATCETPPDWRSAATIGAYVRFGPDHTSKESI